MIILFYKVTLYGPLKGNPWLHNWPNVAFCLYALKTMTCFFQKSDIIKSHPLDLSWKLMTLYVKTNLWKYKKFSEVCFPDCFRFLYPLGCWLLCLWEHWSPSLPLGRSPYKCICYSLQLKEETFILQLYCFNLFYFANTGTTLYSYHNKLHKNLVGS